MTCPMPALRALAATAVLIFLTPAAFAGKPLAVGEAIPLDPPPGIAFRAVYTPPVLHSRWEPADSSFGKVFREPLYTAPRGYIYRYVRGYTAVRVADPALRPVRKVVVRKVAVRKHAVKKVRASGCVTDLGYGRHYYCP